MTNKYDAPSGAPPAYGTQIHSDAGPATPQTAHLSPQNNYSNVSPYPAQSSPYLPQNQMYGGTPQGGYYGGAQQQGQQGYYAPQQQAGGYYQQGPPMNYQQGQPMGYGQQQQMYGRPQQGGYYDQRGSAGEGCLAALMGTLACCCCMDLLF